MKIQQPIRKILVVPLLLAYGMTAQAQTIAIEDFDGGTPSWPNDHASLLIVDPSSSDEGLFVQASDASLLNNGTNVLYGTDLLNESGEIDGASGGTITFADVNVSASTNVVLTFDHALNGFDSTDDIDYVVVLDRGLGTENLSFATGNLDSSETGTVSVNIPDTATTVGLEVTLVQNGGSDDFELDNFKLEVAAADVTPPTLSSSFPTDEDTDILPITNLELTFDEDVQLGSSGNIVIKELVGDAIFESFDVSTTARVTASGSKVTIDPTLDLDADTGYYLEVDNGAIEDTSANDYVGFSGNSTLNFETSAPIVTGIFINEVDPDTPGTDAAEFIELYDGGAGNTSLTGLVLVLFNGGGDISYDAIDLDGQTTDAEGFFVIGSSSVPNVDLVEFTTNGIQNGPDAVALYAGDASDFPNGTPATAVNILDAVVHDDGGANDAALVSLLTPGQSIVSENGTGGDEANSIARSPDGGTQLVTATYVAQTPTPGATNGGTADTTPPAIVTISPADDATDVLTIENLQIFFDEDIQAGTGNVEIYELGNGTPVQTIDIATATIFDSALEINPSDLTAGTDHYVLIDNGAIEDLIGNAFTGISDTTAWSFTTASGTLGTDEAIRTGEIETDANGGGANSDEFFAQSTSGDGNNEYGTAEFDMSFENFSGNSVTDITTAKLLLTVNNAFFATSGDYVILFTTDSVEDLSTVADYDQLAYDDLSTNGIDLGDFTDAPIVVGSGTFSNTTPGGFVDVVDIDLASIEADLITAINSRDSFHFIIGSVDSDSGAITYSGVGNSANPGAPLLAITATTGAAPAAINISESAGSTSVEETGPTSDTFDVVLNAAPTATITVTVTPDAQVTVDSPMLTFTTGDWFTPQTVTVTAVDDAAFEDIMHTGNVSLTASGDVDYSSATNSVSVNILENDFGASDAVINEFVVDHDNAIGSDTEEFIEIYGSPNTDYSSLYILEIEGDSNSSRGTIDEVVQLGTTDANGFLLYNFSNEIENGSITLLLVQGFTGSAGDDIDANDDGTIDNAPWSSIIDGVASFEGGSDIVYDGDPAVVSLESDFDGASGQVGGASRIPDGEDNNLVSDWVRNDFAGFGLAGGPAAGTDGQAENTPGTSNQIYIDVTAPTISSLTPADDATTAILADNLVATFSEDVQAGTGTITLHLSSDNSIVESFDVTTDAIVFGNTLELNPSSDLIPGIGYYVQIPFGAVTDTASTPNAFAGLLGTTAWNFISYTLLNNEDFNDPSGDPEDWFNASVTGTDGWDPSGLSAIADGFTNDDGPEKHYLVSPALDTSSESAITIIFDYEGAYDDGDADSFELVYSLDYDPVTNLNPETTATWTEIPFDFSQNLQAADPVALVSSGVISLPGAIEGQSTAYLAFRYSAGGGELDSELWEIDNILVQSTTVISDPLSDYLSDRGLTEGDLGTDTNGNGFTVIEEYLAGFADGLGPDVIMYGIDTDGTLALTLTSDLENEPEGIVVQLQATSDLGIAFAPVAFTTSVVDNGNGTYTRSYTETTPPAGGQRFLRLDIITVE